MKRILRYLLGLFLLLVGCSNEGKRSTYHHTGIEGTGDKVAAGVVTGFGSVVVNGIHFNTDSAEIFIGGEAAREEDLQAGMRVEVSGSIDGAEGVAKQIRYDATLRGAITKVTTVAANRLQLEMLGQVVTVPEETVFTGIAVEQLANGVFVEVSALTGADGALLATRIASAAAGLAEELEGLVVQIDPQEKHLLIGNQHINYSGVSAPFDPVIGQYLKVVGHLSEDGIFHATTVRDVRGNVSRARTLAVEGLVENYMGDLFELDGVVVNARNAKVQRGVPADIEEGVRVIAVGRFEAGILNAEKLIILSPATTRIRGPVESVDAASGTLDVMGTRFWVDAHTVFADIGHKANRHFNLADVRIGDAIEVYASERDGQLKATRIEREEKAGPPITIKGNVTALLSATEIQVKGIDVDLSSSEGRELVDQLTVGQHVRVEGVSTGSKSVRATRLTTFMHPACTTPANRPCHPVDKPDPKKP